MSNITYKFKKMLGKGAYGSAELVEYNGEEVVLKRQKLGKKANILMSCHSRYLIHFISKFIENNDDYCILMEYCKYQTLKQILEELKRRKKYLSTEGVLKYFTDIVMGLKYLHSHNIIHRDLKPGDFGFAKMVNSSDELTKTRLGTYYFMSPEVLGMSGNKSTRKGYNMKTDIWSLGCILYEICTLQHAFECKNEQDLVKLVNIPFGALNKPIPSFYPIELYHIILKCLQINPDDRPSIDNILNENIIQDFIRKDCGEFLFQLDTAEYDEIAEDYNKIEYYCSTGLKHVLTYHHLIISVFDTLMNYKILDGIYTYILLIIKIDKNEIRIFNVINYISLYIGRSLLLDPHEVPRKMIYQKLDTYEIKSDWKENENEKEIIIRLISYMLKFLSVHHYNEEATAILEEMLEEENISDNDKNVWMNISKNPLKVEIS